MLGKDDVLRLVEQGRGYEDIGVALGIPAGLAYLLATGLPADRSDSPTAADERRPGFEATSTQYLVNRAQYRPHHRERVLTWSRARATSDVTMRDAACRRDAAPAPALDGGVSGEDIPALVGEHNELRRAAQDLLRVPGRAAGGTSVHVARRAALTRQISAALARHQAIERDHLWPRVQQSLPDGEVRAEAAERWHAQDAELFAALVGSTPDSAEFDGLAAELAVRVRRHVAAGERLFLELADAQRQPESG